MSSDEAGGERRLILTAADVGERVHSEEEATDLPVPLRLETT